MRLLLLLAVIAVLLGCSQATPVSVANRSGVSLERVVISGSGFKQPLGTIAPGVTIKSQVYPKGESGLGISFHSGARRVVLPPQGYFEVGGQYEVTVVVNPDLKASVNAKLRSH
jgi:hypothetical protein